MSETSVATAAATVVRPPRQRRSGVLLHPTSLPGGHGIGDLGEAARRFADWLAAAGQTLWQVLPLGPVGPGNSPYMSDSAFAGNPLLIDLEALVAEGWLPLAAIAGARFGEGRVDYVGARAFKGERLAEAAERFAATASEAAVAALAAFRQHEAHWLDDYALFSALTAAHGAYWPAWPAPLAQREPRALAEARRAHASAIDRCCFVQWCFHRQWAALRRHANALGIALIGDMPIYVAHHSAEVWANPGLFELDAGGEPTAVAGVPPDYFSATGQRWGNPLYRWPAHAAEGYRWWKERLRHALALFDRLRIDHFRGFQSYWEVPANAQTAIDGRWRPGPGRVLFDAVAARTGPLPLIAEDLGIITLEVDRLRESLGLPGMRVLQFAFDGEPDNPHLPHNHTRDSVVYTGTHDNDTTVGWWATLDEATRDRVRRYLASDGRAIHWDLIRTAFASVADLAIVPMQDILGLGSEARMNRPGESEGCWEWRLDPGRIEGWQAPLLASMARRYGRLPKRDAPAIDRPKAPGDGLEESAAARGEMPFT